MLYITGYRSPLGFYVIAGIHFLPIWLYAHYFNVLSEVIGVPKLCQYLGIAVLAGGRAVGAVVEVSALKTNFYFILYIFF